MLKRPSNGALALTGGLILAVALGPLVLRADRTENARLNENARQISDMTASERARLERNFARWQQLTPAERQQWREFDERLHAEQARLSPVLDDYYRWLQTIPGYRRDQLRQATDVSQRVSLVDQIVNEQLSSRIGGGLQEVVLPGGRMSIPSLSPDELAQVMSAIERHLLDHERKLLEDHDGEPLAGVERYLVMFKLLGERFKRLPQLFAQTDFANTVLDALPTAARAVIEPEGRPAEFRNIKIAATLAYNLMEEVQRERRRRQPTHDKLVEFFNSQSEDVQEELLALSAPQFQDELRRRYFETHTLRPRVNLEVARIQDFLSPNQFLQGQRNGPFEGQRLPGERGRFEVLRPGGGGRGLFAPGERPGDRDGPFSPRRDGENGEPPRNGAPGSGPPPGSDRPRFDGPGGDRPRGQPPPRQPGGNDPPPPPPRNNGEGRPRDGDSPPGERKDSRPPQPAGRGEPSFQ